MNQILIKNKRLNRKKIYSVLTEVNPLNKEKQTLLENMKHDFAAHLSDRQSDLSERHRRTTNAIRHQFSTLLSQIPSNIQNLTLEEIFSSGGDSQMQITDGPNGQKNIEIKIPKSLMNSTNNLPQVMSQKKRNENIKESTLHKTTLIKSASTRKGTETLAVPRITRSALKTNTKKDVLIGEKPLHTSNPRTVAEVLTEDKPSKNKEDVILKSLSGAHLKPPRKPNPNESIITLSFSTSGTPLLVEQKNIERIKKSN